MTATRPVSLADARRHLSPGMVLAQKLYGSGAFEESAAGTEVVLSDGRTLVDFGSYAVTLLGHRHPIVLAAVQGCLDRMPTSTRVLPNAVAIELAVALSECVTEGILPRVWLGTNGSDAVEVALKLARVKTGRPRVLAAEGAYHGKSLGALAVTDNGAFRPAPLAECSAPVTFLRRDDPGALAAAVSNGDVAAVIVEPVQGEGGVVAIERSVLSAWRADAARLGIFFIADEVQCGFGRCGAPSLAVAAGLAPDAVLLGKSLGGGVMPISAALVSDSLFEPLAMEPFLHSLTFGAHPLSAAAALGALAALRAEQARFDDAAAATRDLVAGLVDDHGECVSGGRTYGLMAAVEFATPALAGEVLVALGRAGLIVSPCLGRPDALRLLPPLVATAADFGRARDAFDRAMDALPRQLSV
jgi:putrescine aminotransferase